MSETTSNTTGTRSMVAAVAAAIGASLCCIGPLVLLALGIRGTWISYLTALEPYHPIFNRHYPDLPGAGFSQALPGAAGLCARRGLRAPGDKA